MVQENIERCPQATPANLKVNFTLLLLLCCRKLKWGVKLKLDVAKTVVGLAAHPTASQLIVLYDDGALRAYVMSSSGLQSAWGACFMLPGEAPG
jgi:hypothetical protein